MYILRVIAVIITLVSFLGSSAGALQTKMLGINGTYSEDRFALDAKELGAGWMRVESWGDQGTYDSVPNTLNRLSNQDIRMLPLVNDYTVSWVTPAGKQQWVDAVVHTATTYAKGGTYWQGKPADLGSPVIEVGNEVYGGYSSWPDQGWLHPEEYAAMLKQAAIATTAATNGRVSLIASVTGDYYNTLDTSGGAGGTWRQWAQDIKTAVPDIQSYLGGVAVHPYGDIPAIGIGTDTDPNFSHQLLQTVHSQWNLPVYVTEEGQKGPQVGRDKQADAVNFYIDELRNNSWIAGVFYYNQKDYSAYDPAGDNGWALIDELDARQPAWYAYQAKAAYFKSVPYATTADGTILTTISAGLDYGLVNYQVDNNETLSMDGSLGATEVLSGGVLKGTGSFKKIIVDSGGIIAPGHSPGCITVNGDYTQSGTYQVEIKAPGNAACTDYDQIVVSGTNSISNLTGGSLSPSLLNGFAPIVGQTYTILDNRSSNAVIGTFTGLPEGAVFALGNTKIKITYKGGDGNDVVLAVAEPDTQTTTLLPVLTKGATLPSAPNTGIALVASNPLYILMVTIAGCFVIIYSARRLKIK